MTDDWSEEETDDALQADRRNFYKVEKWSRDRWSVARGVLWTLASPDRAIEQESFVLLRQLSQNGEQLLGEQLDMSQAPQTRKNKLRWRFHD